MTQPSGPSTTSTADSSGIATVTFSFSTPGSYEVVCSGTGANGPLSSSIPVTITGGGKPTPHPTKSGGGGASGGGSQAGGSSSSSGGLAQTGGNNTLTIAAVGAGLLLAGVGAVVVARRRESGNA
ncbi:MAG: LPXTG cell wall anchor domain-containing protein [Actinobacteria bacterium]|nr:LPXTG cell wall anchor domain-containing protein [Actinomycetota bacterium]MCB9411371.1 LPXTG cell wall anchor domain-containing protein [Actinomycetota bacterium]